jgi:hypothetical protein
MLNVSTSEPRRVVAPVLSVNFRDAGTEGRALRRTLELDKRQGWGAHETNEQLDRGSTRPQSRLRAFGIRASHTNERRS